MKHDQNCSELIYNDELQNAKKNNFVKLEFENRLPYVIIVHITWVTSYVHSVKRHFILLFEGFKSTLKSSCVYVILNQE